MLTHGKIWTAIDALARRYGLSPSGLARRAGLDATAFNPSKRMTTEGRPRWPIARLAKAAFVCGRRSGIRSPRDFAVRLESSSCPTAR